FINLPMDSSSNRPLSRDRAWACVMLNFSISGLGTLKAGRIFAGLCQLIIVFTGFFLFLAWMLEWIYRIIQAEMGETLLTPAGWMWKWGALCFCVSWSWMLLTCVSLMRQAKAAAEQNRQNVPPRLADLPKKN
ncbi:MAG TPA: hypothetical protein VMA13_00095, partial [Candidatus Saccharimonadales bacterium]|nr:hypothetical protein [Candidatus Saccharimonadales bacterium]